MKHLLFLAFLLLSRPVLAAWGSIGSVLTANSSSSGTTWSPTTSATAVVGSVIICNLGTDDVTSVTANGDQGQIGTPSDAAGNTWNYMNEWGNNNTATLADGAVVSTWYTQVTTQLTSGAAITFRTNATNANWAATCWNFSVAAGSTISYNPGPVVGREDDAGDPFNLSCATGVNQEHLFIRGTACESNVTTYTADADFVTFTHTSSTRNSGTAATSMGVRGEYRIATESTSATTDPTYATADCASSLAFLDEVLAAGGAGSGRWGGWW